MHSSAAFFTPTAAHSTLAAVVAPISPEIASQLLFDDQLTKPAILLLLLLPHRSQQQHAQQTHRSGGSHPS
jgi:hypothetical protein